MDVSKRNGGKVDGLRFALGKGELGLSGVPGYVKEIIKERMWVEFYDDVAGKNMTNITFEQFVTRGAPEGLGTDINHLKDMCRLNTDVLDAIDKATKRPAHIHADVDNINVRPTGTSKAQALRRLRKDAPGVHARVIAGEISANAGMIEAGFRKKTATIEATPEGVVRYIMRHMTPFERLYIKDHT